MTDPLERIVDDFRAAMHGEDNARAIDRATAAAIAAVTAEPGDDLPTHARKTEARFRIDWLRTQAYEHRQNRRLAVEGTR